jgi:hypothetical protein
MGHSPPILGDNAPLIVNGVFSLVWANLAGQYLFQILNKQEAEL